MSSFCGTHRVPRGSIDPVDSAPAALAVVNLAIRRPLRPETIALVLGDDRRGHTIVVVDGTEQPDAVLDVVELVAASIAERGPGGGLVVATVRPGGGVEAGDEDRWLEASELADDLGVDLVEWFVVCGDRPSIAANAVSPRDLLGEVPRWRSC